MSDLLNSASLVMIPSGYKEDIVYSAVPTDGSGDLSFTRASNGTRINSAGLVEVCPWNIMEQSEGFNASYWNKRSGTTITANTTTAPNGTATADTATKTSGDGYIWADLTLLPSTTYTISLYAKGSANLYFNAYWGTGSSAGSAITLTSDWQRLSFTFTTGSTTSLGDVGFFISATCDIWGAQLNIGSTAKPYFPTTDRLNVPRLTYQNGGGGCPSLLLEKQSTNSAFPSEDFSGYSGSGATISTNQATSPDGTTNADLIYPAASGNFAGKYKNIAKSTTGVVSCFVKQASKRYAIIGTDNNATYTCIFDLQTATVVYQATNYTGKIESFGNGWYRISAVYTSSSAADYPFIGVADNSSGGVVVDGTNGLYIWGFQYELNSSYETSYISTTSASATRVADACSKTGISSLIGQTEGVIFADINYQLSNPDNDTRIHLSDGSTNKWIFVGLPDGATGNSIRGYVNNASASFSLSFYGSTTLTIGRHKIAFAYKSGSFAIYLDGVSVATSSTTGTIPTCSELTIGGATPTSITQTEIGQFNQVIIFPTRLTNAELASLTTL